MRNLISYYYQLEPDDIHQSYSHYNFMVKNEKYRLEEIYSIDVENVYQFMLSLYQKGIYTHTIVKTITNEYTIFFNQKRYVLLKYSIDEKELVTFPILEEFQRQIEAIPFPDAVKNNNWGELWSEKIDYFEYQMSQFGVKYPHIRESFSYYVGLAEMGISLFNAYFVPEEKKILTHKRITCTSTLYDLYNPFNLTLDLKIRDASEYFKSLYIAEKDILNQVILYLRNPNLSNYDRMLFFIRMVFPSFYFDQFEIIMNKQDTDDSLMEIINKSKEYDAFLKEIYDELSKYMSVPYISWLKKM